MIESHHSLAHCLWLWLVIVIRCCVKSYSTYLLLEIVSLLQYPQSTQVAASFFCFFRHSELIVITQSSNIEITSKDLTIIAHHSIAQRTVKLLCANGVCEIPSRPCQGTWTWFHLIRKICSLAVRHTQMPKMSSTPLMGSSPIFLCLCLFIIV